MRAYRLAYDGQPFRGFQRQPDVSTVEQSLFAALRSLDVLTTGAEKPPGYAAAGRTDAGVSALAQVVAFDAPDWLSPAAFNSELPADIRVWADARVPSDFHATHHATSREYTYYLYARGLDERTARTVLERLAGAFDFHNLTPDEAGTHRRLHTELTREDPFFVITLRSDGFPRQLVRRIVTLVSTVASGDAPLDFVDSVLAPEPISGPDGIGPADPTGLVLTDVAYPDVSFSVDDEALKNTRELFREVAIQRETGMRIASELSGVGSRR